MQFSLLLSVVLLSGQSEFKPTGAKSIGKRFNSLIHFYLENVFDGVGCNQGTRFHKCKILTLRTNCTKLSL